MRKLFFVFGLVLVQVALETASFAVAKPGPLRVFPVDKLISLAPILRKNDLTLIESNDKGKLKQLLTLVFAAAPPETVRDVVIHPERYHDFIRNLKVSKVRAEANGTFVHEYALSYTLYTVDGRHRYVLEKSDDELTAKAPAVELYDPDDNGTRHYRFEFLPAGEGTVIALYGYNEIPHDGFLSRFLDRAPTLEYGFALIPQMTLLLAIRSRAEELAGKGPRSLPVAGDANYEFLLARGAVALFRSSGGKIVDMSLIDRTTATPASLLKVAGEPGDWSKFVPTVARSTRLEQHGDFPKIELEQSLPLVSWTTGYVYRAGGGGVDLFAESGDLRGGRLRWDARPLAHNQAMTELVMRAILHYDQGSMVIRQLYHLEPLLEYGIDLGLSMVILQGVRWEAERLSQRNEPKH